MKVLLTICLLSFVLTTLPQTLSAQFKESNLDVVESVGLMIATKESELKQLLTQLGPDHPEVRKLDIQIAGLRDYLAALDPHTYSDPATQLRHAMQRFADTMDQLGNQIEAIEKLGNQMGVEKSESRKFFFDSSEAMFLAAKTHFSELEKLMGEKKLDETPRAVLAHQRDMLLQAQQVAEAHKQQVQAMEAAVADLLARDPQKANHLPQADARLDQFDERLSRIEKLLEKFIEKERGSESSESDR